ncbi:MAG: phage tail tape measure protein, partial [Bacteroidaceae bacterium]|nr:phage tail tape measure protein [Bacteroidaceae bacterium]
EKNEELEKKKAEIKHKQAVWDKAASISEAIIATSLGVAEALKLMWPMNLVIAALVGAMGAVEIATISATPIPAYAKGTKDKDGHPGGLALVGDAGRKEAVLLDDKLWITPDKPTIVDMPKGAIVYPDADKLPEPVFMTVVPNGDSKDSPIVIVHHDSKKLERSVAKTNTLIKQSIIMQKRIAYDAAYQNYKNTRL